MEVTSLASRQLHGGAGLQPCSPRQLPLTGSLVGEGGRKAGSGTQSLQRSRTGEPTPALVGLMEKAHKLWALIESGPQLFFFPGL